MCPLWWKEKEMNHREHSAAFGRNQRKNGLNRRKQSERREPSSLSREQTSPEVTKLFAGEGWGEGATEAIAGPSPYPYPRWNVVTDRAPISGRGDCS